MDRFASSKGSSISENTSRGSDERGQHQRHRKHHRHDRDRRDCQIDHEQGRASSNRHDKISSHHTKRRERSNEDEADLHDSERSNDEHKSGFRSDRLLKRQRRHTGSSRDRPSESTLNDSIAHPGNSADGPYLKRDSWMTSPSGVGIDFIQRRNNDGRVQPLVDTFRPQGVCSISEQENPSPEEVNAKHFARHFDFDEARGESIEMELGSLDGQDYALKRELAENLSKERVEKNLKPGSRQHCGEDGYTGRKDDGNIRAITQGSDTQSQLNMPNDQTALNRLRAELMKAKLRKAPDLAILQNNYDQAFAAFALRASDSSAERAVVLDASHNRLLAESRAKIKSTSKSRNKDRELYVANDSMSVEDMVREERRTKGTAGGEGLRIAERISKDNRFDDSLDYLDENAEKLAQHMHKSDSNLKSIAVHEYTKMTKVLESCPLCHHEDRIPPKNMPLAPIVSLATRTFLTLSTDPELSGAEGGAVIVPIEHHTNLLECNDDEWEEIRNFMKSLTRLYHDQGRDVIFYENAANPQRRMHAALVAVPIPYELGDTAPAFFREAMLSADEEWSQHRKIIDTAKRAREGLGKSAFRKSIAKEMPYFHAWFSLDGGLGHIVEDGKRWPKGDLFAREVIGGMLDVEASIVKRQGRWIGNDPRLGDFKKRWKKFDWTRILVAS